MPRRKGYKKKTTYNYSKNVGKKNRVSTTFAKIPKRVYSQYFNIMLNGSRDHLNGINLEFWNNELTSNNVIPTHRGLDFSLRQCENFEKFSDLFQSYRMNCVVLEFTPIGATQLVNIPSSSLPAPPDTSIRTPYLYTYVDPNDTAFPSSGTGASNNDDYIKYMLAHKGCNRVRADKRHTLMFRPTILNIAYQGPTTDPNVPNFGYTVSRNVPFIQLNEPDSASFSHFGCKVLLSNANPPGRWQYNVNIKYYFTFFGLKR